MRIYVGAAPGVGKTYVAALVAAALRAGAGLVTVASAAEAVPSIAAHTPELMTAPLAENDAGTIAADVDLAALAEGAVSSIGPGVEKAARLVADAVDVVHTG